MDNKKGKLKIFFGYAAGVGKTYAMLEAGHQARLKGIDVVIGYLEPHDRKETMALARGLDQIRPLAIEHNGLPLREMDIDAILARNPQLVLADELAHSNARGMRHVKRYQDVKELLEHGIDVYTTLNVQHIESLRDLVASFTGIQVAERIPDDVFDLAEQVELVDIEPQDLLERLKEGKVYPKKQAELARAHFFSLDNLTALREIALRRCADRVNRILPTSGVKDHVLVCLSASPSNAAIIRAAARMAQAFHSQFSALYIQSAAGVQPGSPDATRLEENMRLANRLGASIDVVYGEDIAAQIGEYARARQVSKIVLGRQGRRKSSIFNAGILNEKISEAAENAEIFIIPDFQSQPQIRKRKSWRLPPGLFRQTMESLLTLAGACLACWTLEHFGFSEANLLALWIFVILLRSIFSASLFQAALCSVSSFFLFAFLFASPRFSLAMLDEGYGFTFILLIVISLACSGISAKLTRQRSLQARMAARSALLYEASQDLQRAGDKEEIIKLTIHQINRLIGRDVIFYPNDNGTLGKPQCRHDPQAFLNAKERSVALWTLKNNKRAGASTDTLGASRGLYLACRHQNQVLGVVGIDLDNRKLSPEENAILLSLLGQSALALANNENALSSKANALKSQKEKMRGDMLRAISHDLRTPLTTISASAQMLLHGQCSAAHQVELIRTIAADADWLKATMENLLSLTRLEGDNLHIETELTDLEEVVEEALHHLEGRLKERKLTCQFADQGVLVQADGALLVQLVINLIDNALKYTPSCSPIELIIHKQEEQAILEVADHGPGIDPKKRDHLFEPFALRQSRAADCGRSLGLGLSLCQTIAALHNGKLSVADNHPGCRFTLQLPAENLPETDTGGFA